MIDRDMLSLILPAFFSFSFIASSGYIINDIMDRKSDERHEIKKERPVAKGSISVVVALVLSVIFYSTAIILSAGVSREFEGILIIYFFISFSYSIYFKHVVLMDIFFISFGFMARVMAGGEAFRVPVSGWLFLTVFLVALFLGAGKRLGELITLTNDAGNHRKSLENYSHSYLEGILWFSASAALVTYALYTLEHKRGLFYTVPLAAFGLMRYIYIVKQGKGDPTEALLKDGQILGVGITWAIALAIMIYK